MKTFLFSLLAASTLAGTVARAADDHPGGRENQAERNDVRREDRREDRRQDRREDRREDRRNDRDEHHRGRNR